MTTPPAFDASMLYGPEMAVQAAFLSVNVHGVGIEADCLRSSHHDGFARNCRDRLLP